MKKNFLKVFLSLIAASRKTNQFTPEKLYGIHSGKTPHPSWPKAGKKKPIPRPKGSNWRLQDKMGLANDEIKYKRIIVCVSLRYNQPD